MNPSTDSSAQLIPIAVAHHQSGNLSEAEKIYRQILAQNPRQPDALHLLGTVLGQKGDLAGAESLIRKSLSIQPELANAYFNLGEFLRRMGRFGEALATIIEGMRYRPGAASYDNMAAALRDLGCDDAAIDALHTALKFDARYAPAMLNLGIILSENGRLAEAIETFQRLAALRPDSSEPGRQIEIARSRPAGVLRRRMSVSDLYDPLTCIALSAAFTHLHRHQEAIAACERAIQLAPRHIDPYINLGWLYSLVGRLGDAAGACQRAIALEPGNAPAHLNLAVIRLLEGDFSNGWRLYEYRKQCRGFRFPKLNEPPWDGKRLDGKRILLWFEQGLGDTIQFLRYVPRVADLGGKIILAVQPELQRLVEGNVKVEQLVDPARPQPAADVQCSLLSLPLMFKTDLKSIPDTIPYLKPPADLVQKWGRRMDRHSGQLRIGLAWAGRPGHINDANRSMQLKDFGPLASTGAQFFSLQKWKTPSRGHSEINLVDWTDDLADFADTAALIAQLDLVISVDSAVAHLAGAMGAPVWLLVPKAADWRWLLDREDSPWYPTMRIFRQAALGEWQPVIERIGREIVKTPAGRFRRP